MKAKKYIVAIVIGAIALFSGSVYAQEVKSLVGAVIQGEFPVKVNGNQLDEKAIVIDGTSYLPVRAIGNALGIDISFDADLGIELRGRVTSSVYNSPVVPAPISNGQSVFVPKETADKEIALFGRVLYYTSVSEVKSEIEAISSKLNPALQLIKLYEEGTGSPWTPELYSKVKQMVPVWQAQLEYLDQLKYQLESK